MRLKPIANKLQLLLKSVQSVRSTMTSSVSCGARPEKRVKVESESEANDERRDCEAIKKKLIRTCDEKDVGITEFIGKHKPFTYVIKHRYEDFVVHEITKNEEVVRLANNEIPNEDVEPLLNLDEIIGDETVIDELRTLSYEDIKKKEKSNYVKINVKDKDKTERTLIHKVIRNHFPNLESNTIVDTDEHYIKVVRADSLQNTRFVWPENKGRFLHFTLYKENRDTLSAINLIANKMHRKIRDFSYAGTKDKRAITTQRISLFKTPPRKVWQACSQLYGFHVGHFTFEKEALRLGELSGNHFEIVLRDVNCDDRADAEESLKLVKDIGFINYFGMQRFGGQIDEPFMVGLLLLKQRWKEAVEQILSPKSLDRSFADPNTLSVNQTLDLWRKTGNAKLAYKRCAFKHYTEGMLLKGLSQVSPNDYQGALCLLHRPVRYLYLHAIQSYIWNRAASHRIKTYGTKVVIGDLLLRPEINNEIEAEEEDLDLDKYVYYATVDNIDKVTIYDVVLPLLTGTSLLPTHSTADFFTSLLVELDITIDMFRNLPQKWRLWGSYRKIFSKPNNFTWSWTTYTDSNKPLIRSDLDVIKSRSQSNTYTEYNDNEGEEKLALILSMSLSKSCYATSMIREITKTEVTSSEQKPWIINKT